MAMNVGGMNAAGAAGAAGGAAGAAGGAGGGNAEQAISDMQAAFDRAISMSAKVTEITTEKKAQLDAAKQRPQN